MRRIAEVIDVAFWGGVRVASLLALISYAAAATTEPVDLFRVAANDPSVVVDHSAWNRLLQTYVHPGDDGLNRVDYGSFQANGHAEFFQANGHAELKQYLESLRAVDPRTLSRSEQFAFLANLYNAKTIDIVLDHYPVSSIKNVSLGGGLFAAFTGGPWKAKVLTLQGVEFSLDDIEHGVMRPLFKDPRAHYSVNCASVGCPNLQTHAFTGARLDAQLDAAAKAYVNNPRGTNFSGGRLMVSSIYEWFKSDFGGDDVGVLRHLRKYATPSLRLKLDSVRSISSHHYDWTLNDVVR